MTDLQYFLPVYCIGGGGGGPRVHLKMYVALIETKQYILQCHVPSLKLKLN
jgi:hypothetical protein